VLAGWRYQRRNSLLAAELVSGATGVLLSRHDMSLFVASEPHAAKGCCSACSRDGVVTCVPTPNSKAWVRGERYVAVVAATAADSWVRGTTRSANSWIQLGARQRAVNSFPWYRIDLEFLEDGR
jgi:hypothetical protein